MQVERNTPQLVKKGKGKKRPGYRGSSYGSPGRSSSQGPAGGASSGGSPRDCV